MITQLILLGVLWTTVSTTMRLKLTLAFFLSLVACWH